MSYKTKEIEMKNFIKTHKLLLTHILLWLFVIIKLIPQTTYIDLISFIGFAGLSILAILRDKKLL